MSATITTDLDAVTALKAQHRDTWADGDYGEVAKHVAGAPPALLLEHVQVEGRVLLDVATGTGNLALPAAARGARVTGLDLTRELLDVATTRPGGDQVTWVEGDAEALPFVDDAFDVVTSVIGVQFAPRAQVVADELRRVCRPGGEIALVNWTKEGLIGQMFAIMSRYMPKPPPFVTGPPAWGDEAKLAELFAGNGLEITRATNPFRFPSAEAFMTFFEELYGPTKRAREKLSAEGTWDDLRAELLELFARLNQAPDGTLHIESEFLLARITP